MTFTISALCENKTKKHSRQRLTIFVLFIVLK